MPVIQTRLSEAGWEAWFEGDTVSIVKGTTSVEAVGMLIKEYGAAYGLRIKVEVMPLRPQQVTVTSHALQEFNSAQCPSCKESKKPGFWFGKVCWDIVKKDAEIREKLWRHKYDGRVIPVYLRAKSILKGIVPKESQRV